MGEMVGELVGVSEGVVGVYGDMGKGVNGNGDLSFIL